MISPQRMTQSLLLCFPMLLWSCAKPADTPITAAPEEEASQSSTALPESEQSVPTAPVASKVEEPSPEKTELKYINPLTAEEKADGWLSLFDGETLFGWESTSSEINWHVADGAIVADSGPIGFLLTTVPFTDYELICEYRMEEEGNSGLFLRSENPPQEISTGCYEINIANAHPEGFTTGSLVNRKAVESPIKSNADWNEFKVKVIDDSVEVVHNGEAVLSYKADGKVAATGRIGLQKNAGKIEFRKIIIKPLQLQSLFNGKDLTGWREVPGSKSQFTVSDGEIHVKDGQGFIETEQTYKDFLFQAKAISHAKELNSGFFFRAIEGSEEAPSNGYEYQIHNGYKENRNHPNNAGTGAIFRRVDARYVVANDKEWFTATLVAYGPRISCWVDGYHVVDWVDTRKPDPNPRRGLKLEPGHLSIQGHDPTTDLSFKDLNVAEYPVIEAAK